MLDEDVIDAMDAMHAMQGVLRCGGCSRPHAGPNLSSTCLTHADSMGRSDECFNTFLPSSQPRPKSATVTDAVELSMYSPRPFDTSSSAGRRSASRLVVAKMETALAAYSSVLSEAGEKIADEAS